MEEEIICNRWKDLADEENPDLGPTFNGGIWILHQPVVFPVSGYNRISWDFPGLSFSLLLSLTAVPSPACQ